MSLAVGTAVGLATLARHDLSPVALSVAMLFPAALAYAALVDQRTRRIPNRITLPGLALGLLVSLTSGPSAFAASLAGAAAAVLATGLLYALARGGFGMGDVKLSAMAGAILGVAVVPGFLAVAALWAMGGALVALARGAGRRGSIALGPYLAASAMLYLWLAGPAIT